MTTRTGKIMLGALAVGTAVVTWTLLPDQYPFHTLPPAGWGRANPSITQANISQTLCNPKWSTRSIRPSSSYTTDLKKSQLGVAPFGQWDPSLGKFNDKNPSHYEEDHIISLELGGAPSDPMNLWPEPYQNPVLDDNVNLGAHEKDRVENYLHGEVCSGTMTLLEAQKEISTDWVRVYAQMKGYDVPPSNSDD